MKKFTAVLLAATLALGLCACAEDISDPAEDIVTDAPADVSEPADQLSYDFEFRSEDREFKLSDALSATVRLDYDLYGTVEKAECLSDGAMTLGLLREGYIVLETSGVDIPKLWLINIADGSAEQLTSDEAYGHSYQEYYDSVTAKTTTLSWCDYPVLNGDTLDGLMIAYYSNKFTDENGNMTDPDSCHKNGAIWVYDYGTKTERRIDPQGFELSGGCPASWPKYNVVSFVADGRYFTYDLGADELTDSGISREQLFEILNEDEEYDAFLRHGIIDTDPSDSIDVDGTTYCHVTDVRFDTEEHFNASISAHYADSFIGEWYFGGSVIFSDGKTYCRPADENYTDFPQYATVEKAGIFEGTYGDDQYFREFRAFGYTNPDPESSLYEQNLISLEQGDDGSWKVTYSDRNVCARGERWADVPENMPIGTDELDDILKRDEIINRYIYLWNMNCDYEDMITAADPDDGSETSYYKVTDPVFTSADKWLGFINMTYTGEKLEKVLSDESRLYTEQDGKLYVRQYDGAVTESMPKNYCISDCSDGSVTVISRGGYTGENNDGVCTRTYVIKKTADGWRIESSTAEG